MKYLLRVSSTFERELRRVAPAYRERSWSMIQRIQEDPYAYKLLAGQLAGTRSARIGSVRIIYAVDEPKKMVILLHIGYRERVYGR